MKLQILILTLGIFHDCHGGIQDQMEDKTVKMIPSTIDRALNSEMLDVKTNRKSRRKGKLVRRRLARTNVKDLSQIVSSAPVIEGVRMSDDASDKVEHRNGRFINNVFMGEAETVPIPPEYTVTAMLGEDPKPSVRSRGKVKLVRNGRSRFSSEGSQSPSFSQARKIPFKFEFSDFYAGRKHDRSDAMAIESNQEEVYALPESRSSSEPVYFISEDPDSLHADRSPYSFEPADTQQSSPHQAAVIAASNEDFVIKEHTYQMCPGCPSFSIPIPVPKSSSSSSSEVINPYNSDPGYEYQHIKEESFMDRIMAVIQPAIDTAKETVQEFFSPDVETNEISQEGFSDRLSSIAVPEKPGVSPVMYAGLAAMGLGIATLLSSGLQVLSMQAVSVGREFTTKDVTEERNNEALSSDALEYNINDILCIPRNYCEKMKRKKYLLDQYPMAKKVAALLAGLVFDKDSVQERGQGQGYNQCHLRECVYSLLK